jgi:hypothetical protein
MTGNLTSTWSIISFLVHEIEEVFTEIAIYIKCVSVVERRQALVKNEKVKERNKTANVLGCRSPESGLCIATGVARKEYFTNAVDHRIHD